MSRQKLGARLERTREVQVHRHLPVETVDGEDLERSRKLVAWLFAGTRRQLAAVIAAASGDAEVQVGAGPTEANRATAALSALAARSGEMQWPKAIESPAHAFHREWRELKTWARGEGLYVRARMELDPVLMKHTFWLAAWPL